MDVVRWSHMNGLPRTTQKRGKVSLRTQSRWDPRNIRQKQYVRQTTSRQTHRRGSESIWARKHTWVTVSTPAYTQQLTLTFSLKKTEDWGIAQLKECLPSIRETLSSIPITQNSGMVAHTYNSSTWEAEARRSEVHDHLQLHRNLRPALATGILTLCVRYLLPIPKHSRQH